MQNKRVKPEFPAWQIYSFVAMNFLFLLFSGPKHRILYLCKQMRIGLLSDTHNFLDPRAEKYLEECDEIWHAGDIGTISIADQLCAIKPLRAVYGNIDGQDIRKVYPRNLKFMCEGMEVWMTHIGGRPGNYDPEIRKELESHRPKLFVCGHSHILKVEYDKKYRMLYMNPGSAGNYGIHLVKTILRFSVENSEVKKLEVVEFGKRKAAVAGGWPPGY